MKRNEGSLKPLSCPPPDMPFNTALMACKALAELADWHDRCIASGRRISLDELGLLVALVSGLRVTEKIRARELGAEKARCEEGPRQSVWTLGCRLWSLRVPRESTATASSRTLKLMAIGGKLIRGSLTSVEDAEPLISAFAQGVVLGFYRLAKSDMPSEVEGVGFWRHCELAIIHQAGVDGGERIRAQDDRNSSR